MEKIAGYELLAERGPNRGTERAREEAETEIGGSAVANDSLDFDPYDFEPDIPDGHVLCPRCDGQQTVSCHCGGDICVCENYGDKPCPLCGGEYGGEGYVAKDKADAYIARQAEYAAAFRAGLEGK